MLLLLLILVSLNIGNSTWNWQRITLFTVGIVILLGSVANKIWQILKR